MLRWQSNTSECIYVHYCHGATLLLLGEDMEEGEVAAQMVPLLLIGWKGVV